LNISRLTIITLLLFNLWRVSPASEIVDDIDRNRNAGEQLAYECLRGDQKLACFKAKGFSCAPVGEPSRNSFSCYISFEGDCYRKRFQLKENGWSGNDQWVTGECEDTHEPTLQPGVRWMFDNTNAPDFVRFKMLLSSVFGESVDSDDDRGAWRYIAPGANVETEYERISTYLVSKNWEIVNQIHGEQSSLLCDGDRPRFKDSRLHETFDAFDDLMLETYAEHLVIVRKHFIDDGTFDLDAALYGYPGSFSLTSLRTTGQVDDLYEAAVRFCTTPFSMNFTRVEDVE